MRRYLPTLLVIFGLLAVGAIATVLSQTSGSGLDPASAALLLIIGGVLGALVAIGLLGLVFGWVMTTLAQALSDEKPVKAPTPVTATPVSAPKSAQSVPATVPLYDTGSVAVFGIGVSVLVLGFLMLRALAAGTLPGYPLDRAPDWSKTLLDLPGLPVTQALGLGAVAVLTLGATMVIGIVLAKLTAFFGRLVLKAEAARPAEPAKAKAAPAPKAAAGEGPQAYLYTSRSATTFLVAITVLAAAFLGLRSWAAGTPLGFTPLDRIVQAEVFTLPGEPIAGWPAAIVPGPGNPVLAWQGVLLVLVAAVAGSAVVGVGLARLIAQFTATQQSLAQAPPAWPAQELAALEARLKDPAARPFPRRLTGLDQFIILLAILIVGGILAWVLPGINLVGSTDEAVVATQVAASWTPTPPPGPVVTLAELVAKLPAGDPAAGEAAVTARGCVACHISVDASVALVGPAWLAAQDKAGLGVADHAANRWQDAGYTGKAQSPAEYLYESLISPTAYVVAGFQPAMPANFGTLLEAQEQADIIAYLTTLK